MDDRTPVVSLKRGLILSTRQGVRDSRDLLRVNSPQPRPKHGLRQQP
jgi:hypothetical protein